MHLPFKYCEPAFFSGLCDDPVLQVRVRPLGRSLLFDCGQIHHLAKRVLRSIDAVFISHAHMDHFMGMDTLIRHVLVAPRTIEVYGPPGIAARLEHKLRSYDWNLAEDFWCSFRVTEVHAERLHSFILAGPEGFACRPEGVAASAGRLVYANRFVRVEARSADHKIPVLIYRINEIPGFSVDEERLAALGLVPGPWLGELKSRYFSGNLSGTPLRVRRSSGAEPREEWVGDAAVLYENVRVQNPPAAIGYFSDIGWTPDNRRKLKGLFSDLTLLIGECTFLAQ
ncbi:MBL fold metallo-hydrolase, partial [Geoalkalibacter halelectricus]|uniref:MBL fold metallo-hydrolase n=1 Tax=Geoalkalibacter halelectricus TaxID=2847045 RepID=UPI003D232199